MDMQGIGYYSENARKLLLGALASHAELLDRTFATTSEFDSISRLIAHCIGAEERWVSRIEGCPLPSSRYEDRAASDLAGLIVDWGNLRTRTLTALQTREGTRSMEVQLIRWEWQGEMTVEEILFHIFSHELFHRAQISMVLQQNGVDPPNFDYPFLR